MQAAARSSRRRSRSFISPMRQCCRCSARSSPRPTRGAETLFMAACIITAQIVMVPMADAGRPQGRRLGTEADLSRRLRRTADPRRSLHADPRTLMRSSRSRSSTASAPGSSALSSLSSSPISPRGPAATISRRAPRRRPGVWAPRSATRSPDTSSIGPVTRPRFCFSATAALAAFLLLWTAMPETGAAPRTRQLTARSPPAAAAVG